MRCDCFSLRCGLGRLGLRNAGCKALAHAAKALPALSILELGPNKIGDAGCEALAAAAVEGGLPRLELLFLQGNDISDVGCAPRSPTPVLREACPCGTLSTSVVIPPAIAHDRLWST